MIPNLLHPVNVTIRQLDKGETFYDDDFREPVQQAFHDISKIIPGQIKWNEDDRINISEGGAQEKSTGYVLFRYIDLESKYITLNQNDRITKIAQFDVDLFIIGLRPCGHYNGIATMVKAFFKDRQPSRQGIGI